MRHVLRQLDRLFSGPPTRPAGLARLSKRVFRRDSPIFTVPLSSSTLAVGQAQPAFAGSG